MCVRAVRATGQGDTPPQMKALRTPPPLPPAHKVASFCRSRPFDVFLTLEMPSRAPDSVTLHTRKIKSVVGNMNSFTVVGGF